MGIVQKQTVLTSIYIYLGVLFGFFSNIFFKPFGLTTEEIGILSLLDALSGLLSIVFSLGLTQVILNKFKKFKTADGKHNGFLWSILLFSLLGFLFYLIAALVFPDLINQTHGFYNNVYFIGLLSVVIFFRILFKNLDTYVRMNYNATLGIFLESFVLKVLYAAFLLFIFLKIIGFDTVFAGVVIAFSVPGFIMLIYALKSTPFQLPTSELRQTSKKEWATLSFFGLITGTSSMLVLYTDQLMVNHFLGAEALGVYSIMFFIGIFINIPSRGFKGIATAFISDYWKDNDIGKINHFYKRSSNNQGLVAVYIFLCIWICIDEILVILPPEFSAGKYVVFFIGIAQVADMLTGINYEIIATSNFYKWNAYFSISLVILTVISNVIFIEFFGLEGAALATLLSVVAINIARFFLLYFGFGLNPFSSKSIYLTILLVGFTTVFFLIPMKMSVSPYLSIPIKCAGFSLIFWLISIKLKISEDINYAIAKKITF